MIKVYQGRPVLGLVCSLPSRRSVRLGRHGAPATLLPELSQGVLPAHAQHHFGLHLLGIVQVRAFLSHLSLSLARAPRAEHDSARP